MWVFGYGSLMWGELEKAFGGMRVDSLLIQGNERGGTDVSTEPRVDIVRSLDILCEENEKDQQKLRPTPRGPVNDIRESCKTEK